MRAGEDFYKRRLSMNEIIAVGDNPKPGKRIILSDCYVIPLFSFTVDAITAMEIPIPLSRMGV